MKLLILCLLINSSIVTNALAMNEDIEYYTRPENVPLNLPFSEAVRSGDIIYLSGQLGAKPGESKVVPGGVIPESEQTLRNIRDTLKHFKLEMKDIIRCQVMLADISEWPKFNQVYKRFFKSPFPARSAFAGSGLALGARVEVECLARYLE